MVDFVQIGFQKSGSSFFYKLYTHHPEINVTSPALNEAMDSLLLNELILPDRFEYDEEYFLGRFIPLIQAANRPGLVNGIIYEPFTFLYQRRFDRMTVLERLKSIFPNTKVIMFIRSQKSWVRSHYCQYIRAGGLLPFDDFFDLFIKNKHLDAHYIDWYPLISYLIANFQKVHVVIYEKFKEDNQSVVNETFDFLQVGRSTVTLPPVNTSFSSRALSIKRLLNHIVRYDAGASAYNYTSSYKFGMPPPKKKVAYKLKFFLQDCANKSLVVMDRKFPSKNGLRLNRPQEVALEKKYGDGNRKLAQLLGVDLERYGY